MHSIAEKAAISRAFAMSAEEHFVNARAALIRARVVMVAAMKGDLICRNMK